MDFDHTPSEPNNAPPDPESSPPPSPPKLTRTRRHDKKAPRKRRHDKTNVSESETETDPESSVSSYSDPEEDKEDEEPRRTMTDSELKRVIGEYLKEREALSKKDGMSDNFFL
jgi:hypothetical protein